MPNPVASANLWTPDARADADTLSCTDELRYVWDYGVLHGELRRLYEKAKQLQWNASTYVTWPQAEHRATEERTPKFPDAIIPIFGSDEWHKLSRERQHELRIEISAWLISQFLHGEQGALLAASQLVLAAPNADAKLYAATQVMDEARHLEAYDRYIKTKLEIQYGPSKSLKQLLDTILQDSRWDFKYLGMQIMVEGLALAAFGFIHKFTLDPLLKEITQGIMRDEARHVAFGLLGLHGVYDELNEKERREREDFIIESTFQMHRRLLAEDVWEKMGMDVAKCTQIAQSSPPMKVFHALLFSKVLPNLKRLGLLTPYVARHIEPLGILGFADSDPEVAEAALLNQAQAALAAKSLSPVAP